MRQIFLFFLLLTTSFAYGQHHHELKTDLVVPFFKIAHLSYEFIPANYLGVEANLWYRWGLEGNYQIPPMTTFYEDVGTFIPALQQVFIATVAAKYYFLRPAPASGAYLGGYLREDVLTTQRDGSYAYLFVDQYGGGQANNLNRQHNRQLRLAAGLMAGYKRLIGKHVLVEAGLGFDLSLIKKLYEDWAGIPMVRIGYRF